MLTGEKEFILRVKRKGELEFFVARRYSDFGHFHKRLRTELPGKVLPPLPKKNKSNTTTSLLGRSGDDSEVSSISSASTQQVPMSGNQIESGSKLLSVRGRFSLKARPCQLLTQRPREPANSLDLE